MTWAKHAGAIHREHMAHKNEWFEHNGLPKAFMAPLIALSLRGNLSVQKLGEELGLTQQAAGKVVTRMVAAGLVIQTYNKADRRWRVIEITATGNRAIQKMETRLKMLEKKEARIMAARETANQENG